jgi:hypothetical protein
MIELTGNIWEYLGKAVIAITSSGSITRDGRAVLGRGCARQAAKYFPDLALQLGALIREGGNHVNNMGNGLVSFPVEESAWSLPDLRLIARSARELCYLADREGWEIIIVPRPGCGGGGLQWQEVKAVLVPYFDQRFNIISTL